MAKRITHDDGNLIWFDYLTTSIEELDNLILSHFDIANVPTYVVKNDICGNPVLSPEGFEMNNYNVTFYSDSNSSTGYSCMCLNKDRRIYKAKIGYTNGKPSFDEY